MTMRCRLLPMLLLVLCAPVHAADRVESVTSFDKVRIEGPYRVEITTGRGASARLSGDRTALDRVSIVQQGQTVTIRANRSGWTGGWPGEDQAGPVTVRLTAIELRSIAISGSANVSIDRLRGPLVAIGVNGSGRLRVGQSQVDRLDMSLIGAGAVAIAGTAKAVSATVRGSASIEGTGFVANDLRVVSESAGEVALAAKTSARVTATGPGDVRIGGMPACEVTARGSGQVYCGRPKDEAR